MSLLYSDFLIVFTMDPVYQCSRCSVLFTNKRNLSRHQYNHKAHWFACEYCAYTTKRKENLKRHSDKYHSSNNNSPETKPSTLSIQQYQPLNKSNNKIPVVAQPPSPTEVLNANTTPMDFDKRLQLPHNFIYAGATQSGKTTLLLKTLENATNLYEPPPSRIYFLHNCFQQNYEKLKEKLHKQGIPIEFIKKPTVSETDLENMSDQNGGQTLIIIDDNSISAASSREVAQVFTIARHKNCSIVLLLHFVFGPWPSSRIISANTSYFFLLKSPRMAQQISTLGLQLGKQNELVSAYSQASRKPYGYVLLDLCTNTPDNFRIRTDIPIVEEQQNELPQVDSSMSKYGLNTAEVPLQVKAPKTLTPRLQKEPLLCSEHEKNIAMERTNLKRKKRWSRNASSVNFLNNNSTVPFANRYRRYI